MKLRRDRAEHRLPAEETIELFAEEHAPAGEEAASAGPSWLEDRDRLATRLGFGLLLGGFVLMGAAWYGASGVNEIQQQFPYLLSGGLPGLAMSLIGGGIVIVRDIRRERQEIVSQLARLGELLAEQERPPAPPVQRPAANGGTSTGEVVLGRSVFHDPGCRLLHGKNGLAQASREEAESSGLAPCRVCAP